MNSETHATWGVSVRHVTRRYRLGPKMITALDNVSVDIYPGELTVVSGPSGSGKTTLLSIVAGYESPDAGAVVHSNGTSAAEPHWREVSFVPQSLGLIEELTIAENIDMPAKLDPGRDGMSAAELLDTLEIGHLKYRYPAQTSGGEQQRAAIGRALRLNPAVVLADEPTGHQDRRRVDLVLDVLRRHADNGHLVLVSSHDDTVISAADRVISISDGRIVADKHIRATMR
jgi:ABC-type lipoprotein export system ATPase subunit